MAKRSKKEIAENRSELATKLVSDVWADGKVRCIIVWHTGRPTSTGRRDYFSVHTVAPDGTLRWHSYRLAECDVGYRMGPSRETRDWLAIDGCGYSKSHAIQESLQRIAPGVAFLFEKV